MIKVSSAPEEPFSINIEYKGYNIGKEYELKLGRIIEVNYSG